MSISSQWANPADVFSVLLLLGGEVISRVLAQLSGTEAYIAPVAFSFGWVAYSIIALLSAIGENRLMPAPDTSCLVINGHSGYVRQNASWPLARLVRDFDAWMPPCTSAHLSGMLDAKWRDNRTAAAEKSSDKTHPPSVDAVARPSHAGLCVSIFAAQHPHPTPPKPDIVYISGLTTPILQLAIAAIPCGLYGDWGILLVTGVGIVLALVTGALPQWRREKWACRRDSSKTVVLTRGNGAQHAIVVLGEGRGMDLEDLASGPAGWDGGAASGMTVAAVTVLAALWIVLLITAAGLKDHTWFLVAVGGIGMLQNIFVAGARRSPAAMGMPLEFRRVIGHTKVFETLLDVERNYPKLGNSMLETFFPGGRLTKEELARWKEVATYEEDMPAS